MAHRKPTNKVDQHRNKMNGIWRAQTGKLPEMPVLHDWDPDAAAAIQAILEILSTRCTVVIRPGTGARSLGIAIWEPVVKNEPVWFYTEAEWDEWSKDIIKQAQGEEPEQAE